MGQGESKQPSGKVKYYYSKAGKARNCAEKVAETLNNRNQKNKIDSYRTKLISCMIFKDYDRFNQILLQLSNYSDVPFDFAYDLFEKFELNKDVAYSFVNALRVRNSQDGDEDKNEGGNENA